MLWERIKEQIEGKLDRYRFCWLVDPLEILTSHLGNLFPDFAIHIYENPIDFRLFYEPLREQMEEDKPANALVISKSEKIPPDVRRYVPSPLHIKPSLLFPSLHPVIDDILVSRNLVERFAPYYDDLRRGREETIHFVLTRLLETTLSTPPSERDAFSLLLSYHQRGGEVPAPFILPYLAPLEKFGLSPEELLERGKFIDFLRQLLLAWIGGKAKTRLEELEIEGAEELLSSIGLELGEMREEVWKGIDWAKVAAEIPIASIPSLISPLLPEDFYSLLSDRLIKQISRNRRDAIALEAGDGLRRGGKASEGLASLLELVEFLSRFPIPKDSKGWLELGRKIALQWRNVMKSFPPGSPLHNSPLYQEWERLLDRANTDFIKFVLENYPRWIKGKPRPPLSCDVLDEAVLPYIKQGLPVYLLVIDGMSYSQWAVMEDKAKEELKGYEFEDRGCFSILPSATIFSRNAIFAGALPRNIAERYGMDYLSNNEGEREMLERWLREKGGKEKTVLYCRWDWEKALREKADLKALVLNFADEMTHLAEKVAESEEEMLALVEVVFRHRLLPFLSAVRREKAVLVITSDHGSIWVQRTERIPGEEHREAEGRSNRYYQLAKPLNKPVRESFEPYALYIPEERAGEWGLPRRHYLIAHGYFMFSERRYPKKIAVHGGISLWEMCVPLLIFTP